MRIDNHFAHLRVLVLAVAATSFAGCQQQPGPTALPVPTPSPTPTQYALTGNLIIINDCVGGAGAIPVSVKVTAALEDAARNQVSATSPANPINDGGAANSKTGSYRVTIDVPPKVSANDFGPPVSWTNFVIKRQNNDPICQFECTDGTKRCRDLANQGEIEVAPVGQPTNFDIRVRCSCVQPF